VAKRELSARFTHPEITRLGVRLQNLLGDSFELLEALPRPSFRTCGYQKFQKLRKVQSLAEAEQALTSDEEFVRSAAMLMLIEADLVQRDQGAALAKLRVLAGHDHRFAQPVTQMEHALKSGTGSADAISALEAVLESEDHSADFISKPLFATLRRTVDGFS
jgi:hypothetical protein